MGSSYFEELSDLADIYHIGLKSGTEYLFVNSRGMTTNDMLKFVCHKPNVTNLT